MTDLGARVHTVDRMTREAIRETVPVRHAMPAAPFGPVRALWLCRHCSYWTSPDATHCRGEGCGMPRSTE